MGAFLSNHFGREKLYLTGKTDTPASQTVLTTLQDSNNHFVYRKLSLSSNRNRFFQDFLKKNHRAINLLRLADPCLDFSELSTQYRQLERNRGNLRAVKQLVVGWWFDPDETDDLDYYDYDEEDYGDYWDENDDDDANFYELRGPHPPRKDMFTFLGRHLKDMKDLTRLKIDAVSELKKYSQTLQANLKYLKKIKEISINICEVEINKKEILNLIRALKGARSIESLKLSFQWCSFTEESAALLLKALPRFGNIKSLKLNFSSSLGLNQKSYELIAKLPSCLIGLENFILNLKKQNFSNNHVKLLLESLMKNAKLKNYTIVLEHCSQISLWMKLKLCRKNGFFIFNSPQPEYC